MHRACSVSRKQVTVLGINSNFGKTVSFLLKQSPIANRLVLYDETNTEVGHDLSEINTSCKVVVFNGEEQLRCAVKNSDIILIGDKDDPTANSDEVISRVAPHMIKYAEEISCSAPNAIVLVAASPVNSMLSLFTEVQIRNGTFDCNKVMGVTSVDTMRASTVMAEYLKSDPARVYLPVIGGSSPDTRIPLFSQSRPTISATKADLRRITRMVKMSECELFKLLNRGDTLNKAYATVRLIDSVMAALGGKRNISEIVMSRTCLVPDVDYFSLPVILGPRGIAHRFPLPALTERELVLFQHAKQHIKIDNKKGIDALSNRVETSCTPGKSREYYDLVDNDNQGIFVGALLDKLRKRTEVRKPKVEYMLMNRNKNLILPPDAVPSESLKRISFIQPDPIDHSCCPIQLPYPPTPPKRGIVGQLPEHKRTCKIEYSGPYPPVTKSLKPCKVCVEGQCSRYEDCKRLWGGSPYCCTPCALASGDQDTFQTVGESTNPGSNHHVAQGTSSIQSFHHTVQCSFEASPSHSLTMTQPTNETTPQIVPIVSPSSSVLGPQKQAHWSSTDLPIKSGDESNLVSAQASAKTTNVPINQKALEYNVIDHSNLNAVIMPAMGAQGDQIRTCNAGIEHSKPDGLSDHETDHSVCKSSSLQNSAVYTETTCRQEKMECPISLAARENVIKNIRPCIFFGCTASRFNTTGSGNDDSGKVMSEPHNSEKDSIAMSNMEKKHAKKNIMISSTDTTSVQNGKNISELVVLKADDDPTKPKISLMKTPMGQSSLQSNTVIVHASNLEPKRMSQTSVRATTYDSPVQHVMTKTKSDNVRLDFVQPYQIHPHVANQSSVIGHHQAAAASIDEQTYPSESISEYSSHKSKHLPSRSQSEAPSTRIPSKTFDAKNNEQTSLLYSDLRSSIINKFNNNLSSKTNHNKEWSASMQNQTIKTAKEEDISSTLDKYLTSKTHDSKGSVQEITFLEIDPSKAASLTTGNSGFAIKNDCTTSATNTKSVQIYKKQDEMARVSNSEPKALLEDLNIRSLLAHLKIRENIRASIANIQISARTKSDVENMKRFGLSKMVNKMIPLTKSSKCSEGKPANWRKARLFRTNRKKSNETQIENHLEGKNTTVPQPKYCMTEAEHERARMKLIKKRVKDALRSIIYPPKRIEENEVILENNIGRIHRGESQRCFKVKKGVIPPKQTSNSPSVEQAQKWYPQKLYAPKCPNDLLFGNAPNYGKHDGLITFNNVQEKDVYNSNGNKIEKEGVHNDAIFDLSHSVKRKRKIATEKSADTTIQSLHVSDAVQHTHDPNEKPFLQLQNQLAKSVAENIATNDGFRYDHGLNSFKYQRPHVHERPLDSNKNAQQSTKVLENRVTQRVPLQSEYQKLRYQKSIKLTESATNYSKFLVDAIIKEKTKRVMTPGGYRLLRASDPKYAMTSPNRMPHSLNH